MVLQSNSKTIIHMTESSNHCEYIKHISFKNWLDKHLHLTLIEWTKLFKKTFRFTEPKITKEFLMSSGYLSGAQNKNCEVYNLIKKDNPPWLFNLKSKQLGKL